MSKRNVAEWQRERARQLHRICQFIESLIATEGKMAALRKASAQFDGLELPNGQAGTKRLKFSMKTAYPTYQRWLAGGKTAQAFALHYHGGRKKLVPDALLNHWRKCLTTRGKQSAMQIYRVITRDWSHGQAVPGMGTWREWWSFHHHGSELPHKAPEFPFTYSALMSYQPEKVTRALGNFGLVAARDAIRHITRDSSLLRPAEVFTLDDKDGDQKVIDDVYGTKAIVKPTMYFLMDVGPRYIVSFMVRPTRALASDVDELIADGLRCYGRGHGYATHIMFERGTTACSTAREEYFNTLFPGELFVHRTGMIEGYAYAGQWKENSTGKPCSKGMIEAFNGKLDYILQQIPGKDGRTHLTKHTEDLMAIERATGLTMDTPILRLSQFALIVRRAVELYNADHTHNMQGFHKIPQVETQPGVWCDLPTVTTGELHAAIR